LLAFGFLSIIFSFLAPVDVSPNQFVYLFIDRFAYNERDRLSCYKGQPLKAFVLGRLEVDSLRYPSRSNWPGLCFHGAMISTHVFMWQEEKT